MVRSRTLGGPLVVPSAPPHRTAAPLLDGRDKATARAASHFLTLRLAGSPPSSIVCLTLSLLARARARPRPSAPHFTPPLDSIHGEGIPFARSLASEYAYFATNSRTRGVFNHDRVSTSIEGRREPRKKLSRNSARRAPTTTTGGTTRSDWRGESAISTYRVIEISGHVMSTGRADWLARRGN